MDCGQKALIKASFQRVLTVSDLGVELFAGRLYLLDPALWHELGLGAPPGQQALVKMLTRLVADLDRFDRLAANLEAVARRCASEGTEPSQFDTIAETLLWTLQQVLADAYHAQIAAAWSEAVALLVGRMKRAAAAQAIAPSTLRRIRRSSCPELWHGLSTLGPPAAPAFRPVDVFTTGSPGGAPFAPAHPAVHDDVESDVGRLADLPPAPASARSAAMPLSSRMTPVG